MLLFASLCAGLGDLPLEGSYRSALQSGLSMPAASAADPEGRLKGLFEAKSDVVGRSVLDV